MRRECVDHMVVLGEAHLRRVLKSYARYYNESRIYRSLSKDARSLARLSASASHRNLSSAVFTNNIAELILVHTGEPRAKNRAEYVRREPEAVKLIHEILTGAARSMDDFMADALAEKLDNIERVDRLAAVAESRRNASLCEIERRRAVLGATLRQNVQQIENGEFEVIETTPAHRKKAS